MTTELLQQTLDALNDSLDCVQTEYAVHLENYGDYSSHKACIDLLKIGVDKHEAAIKALEVAIAQPVQLAVFPSGLVEILREAANIINAIDIAHAPANIRWPIVDELDGFSLMVAQPEKPATVQGEPVMTAEQTRDWCLSKGYLHPRAKPQPATSAKPVQDETVTWKNIDEALADPVFQRVRAVMGTENWFQDNALFNALKLFGELSVTPKPSRKDLKEADQAVMSGDIVAMIRSLKTLQEIDA